MATVPHRVCPDGRSSSREGVVGEGRQESEGTPRFRVERGLYPLTGQDKTQLHAETPSK